MEIISSTKNQYVKLAHSLSQKKFREETGLFLVEGVNIIKDMPIDVEIEMAFTTKARYDEAVSFFKEKTSIYVLEDKVFEYVSDTVSPYGIAAVLKIKKADFKMPTGKALLLDHIQDPGNLGTIYRTAAACDFKEIYLLNCVDLYSPKVVRSTLGGLFKINTYEINDDEALKLVKGTNSACLDMDGENILTAKLDKDVVFICGNEAHGVSDVLTSSCKHVYSLPMKNGIESLNVAIATAVAMYKTL